MFFVKIALCRFQSGDFSKIFIDVSFLEFFGCAWFGLRGRVWREVLLGGVFGLGAGGGIELLLGLVGHRWLLDHPVEDEVVLEALSVK